MRSCWRNRCKNDAVLGAAVVADTSSRIARPEALSDDHADGIGGRMAEAVKTEQRRRLNPGS
jgi:hypothetical protein